MAETIGKPEVVRSFPAGEAVHTTAVAWTANLTEKSFAIPLGMNRIARAELFRLAYAGVDLLESVNQAQFKIGRELVHRVDLLSQELLEVLESLAAASTGAVRNAGKAAGEMASKTAAVLTPKKQTSASPA